MKQTLSIIINPEEKPIPCQIILEGFDIVNGIREIVIDKNFKTNPEIITTYDTFKLIDFNDNIFCFHIDNYKEYFLMSFYSKEYKKIIKDFFYFECSHVFLYYKNMENLLLKIKCLPNKEKVVERLLKYSKSGDKKLIEKALDLRGDKDNKFFVLKSSLA
jgi:hypothetical protein